MHVYIGGATSRKKKTLEEQESSTTSTSTTHRGCCVISGIVDGGDGSSIEPLVHRGALVRVAHPPVQRDWQVHAGAVACDAEDGAGTSPGGRRWAWST
jgi:hypothetical protein